MKPLNTLLSRTVRIMTFAPFRINTKPIFDYLNFLNVSKTFYLETAKFVFKSNNGLLPTTTIAKYFERGPATHHHNLRQVNNRLSVPLVLLSSFKRKSLHIRGLDIWNNIPESLKLSGSLNIFKKDFKSYVLREYND